MKESLINEGLTLMLAGMGTVFVFLTSLVLAMTLMSHLAQKLQSRPGEVSDEEVAAIAAAIQQHRRR